MTVAMDPETLMRRFETPLGLSLRPAGVPLRVLTNDEVVWGELRYYFRAYICDDGTPPQAVIKLVQGMIDPGLGWMDVQRGVGKKIKEAVREVKGGRLILKRTTGMVMAIQPERGLAIGDLRANLNQGINLINSCFARIVMRGGHLLLHASGVSWNGQTVALAGPPGAGKSTASLQLVERGFRFLSNDRVLARRGETRIEAIGYPKMPRVNPGTLLHNSRLVGMLEPGEREALSALPTTELWRLERKRDVDLDQIYGQGTTELRSELRALVLLRWQMDGGSFKSRRLDAAQALTLLPLFYKDLGAFGLEGPVRAERAVDRLAEYLNLLEHLTIIEVRGGWDFVALRDLVGNLLGR
jgi:HprK-related kinase B